MQAINVGPDGTAALGFPRYTAVEATADRAIHLLALPGAIGAVAWLLVIAITSTRHVAALAIYGCGLIAMLTASAAYNLSRPSRRKELLRRIDHATILVMIAGTYTPFTMAALQGFEGLLFCLAIWSSAAIGIALIFAFPRRFERQLLVFYLVMGWIGLGMGPNVVRHFPTSVSVLLLAGGISYSVGALIHSWRRFRFQNVVWHTLVVFGASLHYMAVVQLTIPPS